MKYMTLCLIRVGTSRHWVKAPAYKVSPGDIVETTTDVRTIRETVEACTIVAEDDELLGMLERKEQILEATRTYSLTWDAKEGT